MRDHDGSLLRNVAITLCRLAPFAKALVASTLAETAPYWLPPLSSVKPSNDRDKSHEAVLAVLRLNVPAALQVPGFGVLLHFCTERSFAASSSSVCAAALVGRHSSPPRRAPAGCGAVRRPQSRSRVVLALAPRPCRRPAVRPEESFMNDRFFFWLAQCLLGVFSCVEGEGGPWCFTCCTSTRAGLPCSA